MDGTQLQQEEIMEIDLVRFCKKALLQWRAILCFGILFAVIVSGVQYVRAIGSYKTQLAAIARDVADNAASLEAEEVDAVNQAVLQQAKIKELQKYVDDSLYMHVNALNYKRLDLLYYVHSEGGVSADDVMALYHEYLLSYDSTKTICEKAGIKVSEKYINELLSITYVGTSKTDTGLYPHMANSNQNGIMRVSFILTDDLDKEAVQSAIEELVAGYDVSKYGITSSVTVTELEANTNSCADIAMQNRQQQITANLTDLKASQKTTVTAFSDAQKEYMDQELLADTEVEETDKKSYEEELMKPSFSKKYFAIGFVLGVFLYIFVFAMMLLFGSKVSSVLGAGLTIDLISLADPHARKNWLFFDSILYKVLYKKELAHEDEIPKLLASMRMYAKEAKQKEFQLLSIGFSHEERIDEIIAKAKESGLEMKLISTSPKKPEDIMDEIDFNIPTALVVEDGITLRKDLTFVEHMFRGRKAELLGCISLM